MNISKASNKLPINYTDWHSLELPEVFEKLESSSQGLTSAEVRDRLKIYGYNEIKEAKTNQPLKIFLGQFKSIIIWILIVAGLISGFLGDTVDCIAIMAIVLLNAIIGFYQEYNAEKSIAALKKMTSPKCKVWRNRNMSILPASEIVPGDILELEAGDVVGADARLLVSSYLKCVEAALTGESNAVLKNSSVLSAKEISLADRENMIFMGTSVAAGSGRAIVVATAMNTEIGKIAKLIHEAGEDESTPLQQKLNKFGSLLVWSSIGIVLFLFVIGIMRGTPFFEMLMTTVSLAVAAVPEGLPAIVTITFSLGVLRMSRRHALIRKLPAVETLGSTNVICTDKTGTLTVGEMTVRAVFVSGETYEVTGEGYEPKGEMRKESHNSKNGNSNDGQSKSLLTMAHILIGCNNSHLIQEDGVWKVIGDPTEGAMLSAGIKAGGNIEEVEIKFPKLHELPFDSDRKCHSVVRQLPNGDFFVTMAFTGLLTAGVSFSVFLFSLNSNRPELAQTHAFSVLVFAELFRSFGVRSEVRNIWNINLFSNFKLLVIVGASIALQIWSHHNLILAKFFKTFLVPINDCLVLIALSLIPLILMECLKFMKQKTRGKR